MIIAVASGKGGTGKTTLSVALALASQKPVTLLDCDVEEPNDLLFFNPAKSETRDVNVNVPCIDKEKCAGCGECSRICAFNAIVIISGKALVFPELCHSCGGCMLVCPEKAIREVPVSIGSITQSSIENITLVQGELKVGKAMSPPVIREVKHHIDALKLNIIDSPPGTSCPMVTSVRGSDYIILVTEPTPFGLHDLNLAVNTIQKMNIPFGVVINRSDAGDDRVERFCKEADIEVLMRIPEDRRIAESGSRGETILAYDKDYSGLLFSLLIKLEEKECRDLL